jgi:hypothetical protein
MHARDRAYIYVFLWFKLYRVNVFGITDYFCLQGTKLHLLGFAKLRRKLCPVKLPRNSSDFKFRVAASLMQAFLAVILIAFWASLVPYLVSLQTSANSFE